MAAAALAILLTAHPLDAVPVSPPGPMPWHLADVNLFLPKPVPLTTLSVDLHVLDDPPPWHRLFVVPMAGFVGGEPFYVGQMTQLAHCFRADNSGYWPHLPDGFVYSRRGDTDRTAVRQSVDGFMMTGEHEGPHVGVRVLHRWRKGRYTYRLVRTEQEFTAAAGWGCWFAAFVVDHRTLSESYVGSLRFPGHTVELTNHLGWFAEVYQTSVNDPPPSSVPLIRLAVGNWKLNGAPLAMGEVSVTYPEGVPQVAEVKPIRRFVADGDYPSLDGLPQGNDAAGLIIRNRELPRKPSTDVLWPRR